MPQPSLATSGGRHICKWGGLAQPQGQGVLSQIDLNDLTSWFIQWDQMQGGIQQSLSLAQLLYQAESTYLASDYGPGTISLPMEYREASSGALGAALAKLAMAGEQQLTFDNATFAYTRFLGTQQLQQGIVFGRYSFALQFQTREQWWRDMSPSTLSPTALNSGSPTNINVTYNGSVFARPKWTLHIPNTNTAPIQSFVLTNTMTPGPESLTVLFPGNLAASTTWDITIDCGFDPIAGGMFTVKDGSGNSYDGNGSFPMLYGPVGTVNAIRATLTPASGTATGCTIAASWVNRWVLF